MILVHIFSNLEAINAAYWAHIYVSLCDFTVFLYCFACMDGMGYSEHF